ncbi:hypothetical protein [Cytobacillus kochii]|uniref:hypothetical protein n=1 Tax=Cytobacillus kochii TaxID=859143 RepID=UPI00402A83EC
MKRILENVITTATTIFLPRGYRESVQIIEESTHSQHEQSAEILNRSLEEITAKFRITDALYANEIEVQGVIKHEFTNVNNLHEIQQSFANNEGVLYLVDSNTKKEINRSFIHNKVGYFSRILRIAPDFVYELNEQQYWINIEAIRNVEEEHEHTKSLNLLYRALYQATQIHIDVNFEYGKTTKERTYQLEYFRVDRNSLFIVMKDFEDNSVYSHNFEHIRDIKCSNRGEGLNFWLYMAHDTYRFYIPYTEESLNNPDIPIDPIIKHVVSKL